MFLISHWEKLTFDLQLKLQAKGKFSDSEDTNIFAPFDKVISLNY